MIISSDFYMCSAEEGTMTISAMGDCLLFGCAGPDEGGTDGGRR